MRACVCRIFFNGIFYAMAYFLGSNRIKCVCMDFCELLFLFAFHTRMVSIYTHTHNVCICNEDLFTVVRIKRIAAAAVAADDDVIFLRQKSKIH